MYRGVGGGGDGRGGSCLVLFSCFISVHEIRRLKVKYLEIILSYNSLLKYALWYISS